MRRVDALDKEYGKRLRVLSGSVLTPDLDEVLQRIVQDVAREMDLPIALVSLVLERTQFFRAHVGLPPDLAVARATDRDASFCQFVVRDGTRFEVVDAARDDRVPQELVERYGVRAYLGEPLSLDGEVIGSLCGVDTKPREFSDADRAMLVRAARDASARLAVLAARPRAPSGAVLAAAATPAFAEIRNLLAPLLANIGSARVAVADLGPLARLSREVVGMDAGQVPALGALDRSLAAFDDLAEIIDDLDRCGQRLHATLRALEKLILPGQGGSTVAEVIEAASALAHHHTKLVGGVTWGDAPAATLGVPRAVAVSTLAAALSLLADSLAGSPSPLWGRVTAGPSSVTFEAGAARIGTDVVTRCAEQLQRILGETRAGRVSAKEGCLCVTFQTASGAGTPA